MMISPLLSTIAVNMQAAGSPANLKALPCISSESCLKDWQAADHCGALQQPLELQSTITLSPKDGVWVKPVQLPQLVTMQHRDHEMATHEEHKLPADHGD